MTTVALSFFWTFVFLILYTYAGYVCALIILSLFIRRPVKSDDEFTPMVTYLITAYNEEADLARKIENTLSLDYPADRLELLVASDGSTDRTDDIVRGFHERDPRARLLRVEGRVGKTETQNQAVKEARGEVIIFSDATTEYENSAIRNIVRNYADPAVGAVSGRYNYVSREGSAVGVGQILFWKFENFIKTRQTRIRTITGCCGCIYSVRKSAYEPLPPDIISDLCEPLKILQKNYRIVFEPEAIAFEETTEKSRDEFHMRVRVILRGMRGIFHVRNLLNPLRFPFVAFQLLSHKVSRWLVPLFVVGAFVSNAFLLDNLFYQVTFGIQCAFFGLALLGWGADLAGKKIKILSIPLYFCIVNIASIVSLFKLMKGEKKVVWETAR